MYIVAIINAYLIVLLHMQKFPCTVRKGSTLDDLEINQVSSARIGERVGTAVRKTIPSPLPSFDTSYKKSKNQPSCFSKKRSDGYQISTWAAEYLSAYYPETHIDALGPMTQSEALEWEQRVSDTMSRNRGKIGGGWEDF